jgi:hypothetical protein
MEQLSLFNGREGEFEMEQKIILPKKQEEELKQAMALAITDVYRKESGNYEQRSRT